MAEQEVIKHTKRILGHLTNGNHSLRHRLGELTIEIAIIVFAVSISVWLHGIGEHRHEQEQVKTFLLGVKIDLMTDMNEINKSITALEAVNQKYHYLAALDPSMPIDKEKFDEAFDSIDDPMFPFISHKGRYESFKSSGKLTNIENEVLLERIVDLYEVDLVGVHEAELYWNAKLENLKPYIGSPMANASQEERYKMITEPKGKHLCTSLQYGPLNDYKSALDRMKTIIREIDLMYPGEADKPVSAQSQKA